MKTHKTDKTNSAISYNEKQLQTLKRVTTPLKRTAPFRARNEQYCSLNGPYKKQKVIHENLAKAVDQVKTTAFIQTCPAIDKSIYQVFTENQGCNVLLLDTITKIGII